MPELYPEVECVPYPDSENLQINLIETVKKLLPYKGQIFDSVNMQRLFDFFKEKKIKETQLSQLDRMEEYVRKDSKANKDLSMAVIKIKLITKLEVNEQHIKEEIQKILTNDLLKDELRSLPQRSLELTSMQKQLAEELSEEKISEEEIEGFKISINNELDRLCSETLCRLYRDDVQAIYSTGISDPVIPYLKNLCQLNEEIRREAEDKVADYYMELAEQLIAQNSRAESQIGNLTAKNIHEDRRFSNEVEFNEDASMPPLYRADTVDLVNELLLNGADPIKESKRLSITPLAYQFASRYVIEQTLNGVNIGVASMQAELKKHPPKALKEKLKNKKKELNAEIKELKLELEKNDELIKAHIRAIVLKDSDALASQYPDVSRSENYQQIWNDCKQEVEKMQQTKLTENCTVYDFLTESLEKLPDLPMKTLKSVVTKFPHYSESLLPMQINMLDNYRVVQGAYSLTERMVNIDSEQTMTSSNYEKGQGVQKTNISRLANSAFFGVISDLKPTSALEKLSTDRSQLNRSTLFFRNNEVKSDPVSKKKEGLPLLSY